MRRTILSILEHLSSLLLLLQEIRSVEHGMCPIAEFIGDSARSKCQIAYFIMRMRATAIFLLPSKIWHHHRVPWPRFPTTRGNFGDTWTFKADIAFLIFAWIFKISGSKMGIFRGKIGKGVGRYWPPTNSFLLLLVYTSVSNFVKIDKELRPWEWAHTDRQTDANRFYYLSHAVCYSYGADNHHHHHHHYITI